jgi:hypothetical protein
VCDNVQSRTYHKSNLAIVKDTIRPSSSVCLRRLLSSWWPPPKVTAMRSSVARLARLPSALQRDSTITASAPSDELKQLSNVMWVRRGQRYSAESSNVRRDKCWSVIKGDGSGNPLYIRRSSRELLTPHRHSAKSSTLSRVTLSRVRVLRE